MGSTLEAACQTGRQGKICKNLMESTLETPGKVYSQKKGKGKHIGSEVRAWEIPCHHGTQRKKGVLSPWNSEGHINNFTFPGSLTVTRRLDVWGSF